MSLVQRDHVTPFITVDWSGLGDHLTTLVSDTGDVDQDLMNWLSIGTLFDALPNLTGDEAINFATHLTVVGDVLVPHGANRVAAP